MVSTRFGLLVIAFALVQGASDVAAHMSVNKRETAELNVAEFNHVDRVLLQQNLRKTSDDAEGKVHTVESSSREERAPSPFAKYLDSLKKTASSTVKKTAIMINGIGGRPLGSSKKST
ncbi:hypothetical protein PsorP6_016457 [Peronosclerospora sorghi]|uniref:Uncharacterized protein n=1 Tax=Peronosclerospora sorghi TaxID=230839 RepID=A0ACC0VTN3_9STRA|nr:hypothetical protein PsorP6_016457 [Peronosclerospora sorghi]